MLFLVLAALAAIPSTSVLLVITRSATMGKPDGMAAAIGIVVADLVFVGLAVTGSVSGCGSTWATFSDLVRYLGAIYLIWFGFKLMFADPRAAATGGQIHRSKSALMTSFAAGFVLTLGDVKAILFYASRAGRFLSTCSALGTADTLLVLAITAASVGGVKIAYALGALKGFEPEL